MPRIHDHPVLAVPAERREVRFTFDASPLSGFEGEALASALMAAGIERFSIHPKGDAPQGIFCANGQCSQCTVLVDGVPKKACVTPLAAGMDVRTLRGLPVLSNTDIPLVQAERRTLRTDILVVGGGPSGLSAAYELGRMGFQVILADDKARLGGKLVLQTHKFFGSEQDCYAGVRGIDIATKLEEKVRALPNVTLLSNAPVVAIYKDRRAGVYKDYSSYVLVDFTALVVAAGAREKTISFPGNDLPGVYGAGAFQTLVNRDLVRASSRVLIVGSGNVGLIAAYHALQAGIQVVGIVELMGKINGYKVHADKIRRAGVPIYLNTTVMHVEGAGHVQRAITCQVDDTFLPIPGSMRQYNVDTVLVATGLAPCDEFLVQAQSYGIMAVAAGDAEEIAEASSAMFGGRIAAYTLAKMLMRRVDMDPSWLATRDVLKSRPGDVIVRGPVVPGKEWRPVFFCTEEIPCNPCTTVCPTKAISLRPLRGNLLDLPYFSGDRCVACFSCVATCPGLAVSLVRKISDTEAEVALPWEFKVDFEAGHPMRLLDQEGVFVQESPLAFIRYMKKQGTHILGFRVSLANAGKIAGIAVQPESATASTTVSDFACPDMDVIVCRCERISMGEIVQFIRDNNVRDINQLKTLRVGMGACGAKTCSQLLARAFRLAGVDIASVEPGSKRPLFLEVPMGELVNEGLARLGGKDSGRRGAP